MSAKITRDVLESYLSCKFKGHLKLAGQTGVRSDYEAVMAERREEVRLRAVDSLLARHPQCEVARGVPLTAAALRQGPAFILDAALEDDLFSLRLDGLKRVEGASGLGGFHYAPVLFHEGKSARKEQRLLLEVFGLLLSRVQGRVPAWGIVWHGSGCKASRVRLGPEQRRAEQVLRELEKLREAGPPRLALNDHCQVCEFRRSCHEQAVREDSFSLLRGVGEKEARRYARKGVLTLTQLAHTFRPRRKGKRQVQRAGRRHHALQALAIRDKRVYLFGTPELPDRPVKVYLDVEGLPDEGFVYLIGMVVVQGGTETRHSFWADGKGQEREIFERFLAEVGRLGDFAVYSYGSYEREFLKRMRKAASSKGEVDRVLDALVNVLSLVYSHVYFPCYSNGLKDVAGCLGCSWTEPEASGVQSIAWRRRWEATRDEQWKEKLTTYNLEDCLALKRVAEFVHALRPVPGQPAGATPAVEGGPPVAPVEELDRLGAVCRRGKIDFFHADFEYINGCGRFDYQSQRVYARTGKVRKKRPPKGGACRNRALRVSQRVQVISKKCPYCGGSDLARWEHGRKVAGCWTKGKKAFDLVFTPGGVRRKVVEVTTLLHECLGCGEVFVPDRYRRLAKHFHGLMSWAMYEHVAHRLSCSTLEEMLQEHFGVAVCQQELNRFKPMMARYYRPCYRGLLSKILSSDDYFSLSAAIRIPSSVGQSVRASSP
jgi:predicted RecB family nuclease